jgi:RNA-directed DNA polymerase
VWCRPSCSTAWITLWQLLYKWATWSHANKPKFWIVDQYFGKFNKFRNDRWVFGRDSDTYLVKFSWTPIVRHVTVTGTASPARLA